MLFGKAQPVIRGGAVVVRGLKYDIDRVLYSYQRLIDAFTGRFGGRSDVGSRRPDFAGPFPWPGVGAVKAIETWRMLANSYDVLGESFAHRIGPFTAKAHMLGKAWAVYDKRSGTLTTPQRKDIGELDGGPVIDLMGAASSAMAGVDTKTTMALRRIVTKDLAQLQFSFGMIAATGSNDERFLCWVRFTDVAYGRGEDWIRVRCVAPDGSEVEATAAAN